MQRFVTLLLCALMPIADAASAQRGYVQVASTGDWRYLERPDSSGLAARSADLLGSIGADMNFGVREARLRFTCDSSGGSVELVGIGAQGHGGISLQWNEREPEPETDLSTWQGMRMPTRESSLFVTGLRINETLRVRIAGMTYTIDFRLVGAGEILDRLGCFSLAGITQQIATEIQAQSDARNPSIGSGLANDFYAACPTSAFAATTIRPQLLNLDEIGEAVARQYPPVLRDVGIGGATMFWILVDTDGTVVEVCLREVSGFEALDAAALSVAQMMRFSPAYYGAERVSTWVQRSIGFRPN